MKFNIIDYMEGNYYPQIKSYCKKRKGIFNFVFFIYFLVALFLPIVVMIFAGWWGILLYLIIQFISNPVLRGLDKLNSNTLLTQPSAEGSLISVKRESADSQNSPHDSSAIKEEANFS